jgi:hypothetical protein
MVQLIQLAAQLVITMHLLYDKNYGIVCSNIDGKARQQHSNGNGGALFVVTVLNGT